jgi:hypothetical protein
MTRSLAVTLAAGLGLALDPSATLAQSAERAEQLFVEGKSRMAAGELTQACPLLEESYRLDSATGALLALAICHEQQGKLASAQREYAQVAVRSASENNPAREQAASERAVALASEVSTLTLRLAAPQPEVVVRLDGAPLDAQSLGQPIAVDGGEHVVEASAAGKLPFRAQAQVAERGDTREIVIPELASAVAPPAVARAAQPVSRGSPAARSAGLSTEGWLGLGTIGAGAIGLGLGAVFALQAGGDAPPACSAPPCAAPSSTEMDEGDAAALSLVIGGVLVAVGSAVYFALGQSGSSDVLAQHATLAPRAWAGRAGGASVQTRF